MYKYLLAFVMLLAVGAGCTANFDIGNSDTSTNSPDEQICVDMCGNGSCEEIVCQGSGCPCAETAGSCATDCAVAEIPATDDTADNTEAQIDDLIVVSAPLINANVNSPVTLAGQARGNWYFEASFPVKVYDANNALLGTGIATAVGDWMTTDFVPFTAVVSFSTPTTTTGKIVLEKSNASGLPENDASLEIPVTF